MGSAGSVSLEDLEILAQERADDHGMVRVELELVFRTEAAGVERDALVAIRASGGELVARTRIDGAKYHALLTDLPQAELQRVLARGQEGLVAYRSVMHIRPQCAVHLTVFEAEESIKSETTPLPEGDPIAAIFDAVPLTGHPRLDGRLSVYDPFGLEPLAVGPRLHGTGMASAVVHGDIAGPTTPALGASGILLQRHVRASGPGSG